MHEPLPDGLKFAPFSVSEAQALGVGLGRLKGKDLEKPFRGIRSPVALGEAEDACRAYQLRMPHGQFFSHVSAARLYGIPLPLDSDERVHVSVFHPAQPPRTRGVVGHQLPADSVRVAFLEEFVVTSAVDTWCALGSMLLEDDLVVAGDYLVSARTQLATIDELRTAVGGRVHSRGVTRLRRALPDIRIGSESPKETELRLLLQRAGFPEPELNVDIHDRRTGRWIARGDQVHRRYKVLVEYDGDQHRTSRRQYVRDVRRLEDLAHAGWLVVHVLKEALDHDPADVVRRVDVALRSRGWQSGRGVRRLGGR
jgi:hypothetical protein